MRLWLLALDGSRMMSRRYTMLLRPVSPWTLPEGVTYELTALPWDFAGNRPELERSRDHMFGEFTLSRDLTKDELDRFSMKVID